MPPSITITPLEDYLYVCVEGFVGTIDEIIGYGALFRAAAMEHRLRRLLLDYTAAKFDLDYHDLMVLADHATGINFHLDGLRLAALVRPKSLASHRHFETIANNRSISYRVFSDETKALEWLRHP